jgi:16S rRNA (cytosine967-C5)-methyltransferase
MCSDPILDSVRPGIRERSVVHSGRHVVEILLRLRNPDYWVEQTVAAYTREHPQLGSADRRLIGDLVFAIVRFGGRLQAALQVDDTSAVSGPPEWTLMCAVILHLTGYRQETIEAFLGDAVDTLIEPRWLERATESVTQTRLEDSATVEILASRSSYPNWIVDRFVAQYGWSRTLSLLSASQYRAPTTFRVNTLKTTRDEVLQALRSSGVEATPTSISPDGVTLNSHTDLRGHDIFRNGWIDVQDEGSQIIVQLANAASGNRVVDACAGAGGKTLGLAAAMSNCGELLALDVDDAKLRELRKRTTRAGISIVKTARVDQDEDLRDWVGAADVVLVDAPCSGSGIWRRIPDGPRHLAPDDLAALGRNQRDLLARYSELVRPGGKLVYATCSLFHDENQAVVESFLGSKPNFSLIPVDQVRTSAMLTTEISDGPYMALTPDRHSTDGFFAAVMERAA